MLWTTVALTKKNSFSSELSVTFRTQTTIFYTIAEMCTVILMMMKRVMGKGKMTNKD